VKGETMMSHSERFVELLRPVFIGKLHLKNRIIMAPVLSRTASKEGYVTDKMIECYALRARSGLGMMIIEAMIIDASDGLAVRNLVIDDDKFIARLRGLTEAIHRGGAKVAAQLLSPHQLRIPPHNELVSPGPSTIHMPNSHGGLPVPLREISVDKIKHIVSSWAAAAIRVKNAGFDGIEVHAAHGYLLPRFLSPALNKRVDRYGGRTKNRARFLSEVMQSIKEAVGQDFPVWCRINAVEPHIPGGVTIEEMQEVSRIVQDAGSDAIHVSAPFSWVTLRGGYVGWAALIKDAVRVPVIAVGNLDLELGEQIVREGKADIIALAKPLLADGELVSKTLQDHEKDVVPCIRCMKCHIHPSGTAEVICSVNPTLYREAEVPKPASKTKRIFIIGGGPSGMEAALIAKKRGHEVILCERENRLGGQLWSAAKLSYKLPILKLIEYFKGQLKKLAVDVWLDTDATPELVDRVNPDAVILATGVMPLRVKR
jgi:2,4-dienoyl-CoA reductase-like NADH-dependent reductase (Old Yellow Enzyme family)